MPWQQQQHMQMQQQYGMLPAYQQHSAAQQQQYMQHPGQMQMQVGHLPNESSFPHARDIARLSFGTQAWEALHRDCVLCSQGHPPCTGEWDKKLNSGRPYTQMQMPDSFQQLQLGHNGPYNGGMQPGQGQQYQQMPGMTGSAGYGQPAPGFFSGGGALPAHSSTEQHRPAQKESSFDFVGVSQDTLAAAECLS